LCCKEKVFKCGFGEFGFMAVVVNDYGKFRTAEGTLSEVVSQLDADERTTGDVVSFEYDGSDYSAVYQIE
jgi:hypothetical protein